MTNRSDAVLREGATFLLNASKKSTNESFTLCGRPQAAKVARLALRSISRWLSTQADAIADLDAELDNFMPEEFRPVWALAAQLPITTDSQLVAAYLAGSTLPQLEKRYKISFRAVRETLLAHDVELRAAGRSIPRSPRGLRQAYENGSHIRQLADEHRLTYGVTRRMLIRDGVVLRAPGGS